MQYLEMSRDEIHGGGSWAFGSCVWSSTKKSNGGSWPFWHKILQITAGDTIFHLKGIPPNAYFVGYSTASGDGFETTQRPPYPGKSKHETKFFRANLSDFESFHDPVNLTEVFRARHTELNNYFDQNKKLGSNKLNLFYVRQANRLQCLNGAYLSDIDENLLTIIFGSERNHQNTGNEGRNSPIKTGSRLSHVLSRIGHSEFSKKIKELYKIKCCFPGCEMNDRRFLIGSHIARWSDNKKLRGKLGNGLCLCTLHDKAFEIGLFTLDQEFKVSINPKEKASNSKFIEELSSYHGQQIKLADTTPLDESLREHWRRIGFRP